MSESVRETWRCFASDEPVFLVCYPRLISWGHCLHGVKSGRVWKSW